MPALPIKELVLQAIEAKLIAMGPPDYTYCFAKVRRVRENEVTVNDEDMPLCLIVVGDTPYVGAGLQATGERTPPLRQSTNVGDMVVYRDMPVVVAFVLSAAPSDPTDPLSGDRALAGELMFADLNKSLAQLGNNAVNGSSVQVKFLRDVLNLTTIAAPKVYGELHCEFNFRHRYGDATRAL